MNLGSLMRVETMLYSSGSKKELQILSYHWFLIVFVGHNISVGLLILEITSIPRVVFPAQGAAITLSFLSER